LTHKPVGRRAVRWPPDLKTYGSFVAKVDDEREQDSRLIERGRRQKDGVCAG